MTLHDDMSRIRAAVRYIDSIRPGETPTAADFGLAIKHAMHDLCEPQALGEMASERSEKLLMVEAATNGQIRSIEQLRELMMSAWMEGFTAAVRFTMGKVS
jgi:hypothetical protein